MFCDEALDAIEAIAAGDLTPQGRVAQHLDSCRQCAAALEAARRLDRMLHARPVPKPPQQFTSRTMARVRRARWRREQVVDAGFNLALGLVALGVVAWVGLLLFRGGLMTSSVSPAAVALVQSGVVSLARRVAPSLPLYGAATALVLSALAIWWWAERDAAL
jgi:predicted anti-sigma-YlaC factor YlaD